VTGRLQAVSRTRVSSFDGAISTARSCLHVRRIISRPRYRSSGRTKCSPIGAMSELEADRVRRKRALSGGAVSLRPQRGLSYAGSARGFEQGRQPCLSLLRRLAFKRAPRTSYAALIFAASGPWSPAMRPELGLQPRARPPARWLQLCWNTLHVLAK